MCAFVRLCVGKASEKRDVVGKASEGGTTG